MAFPQPLKNRPSARIRPLSEPPRPPAPVQAAPGHGVQGRLPFPEPPSLFDRPRTDLENRWLKVAREVSDEFARTAPERHRRRAKPLAEIERLRQAGLTTLLIPEERGGGGGGWPLISEVVREISAGDASLGVLLTHHYFFIDSLPWRKEPQRTELEQKVLREKYWMGIVGNPRDPDIVATPAGNGKFRLNGRKSFCTGTGVADFLAVAALRSDNNQQVAFTIPPGRPGVVFENDWDAIGLPLADSGTVSLVDVEADETEISMAGPVPPPGVRYERDLGRLGPPTGHLLFSNVYLGVVVGALRAAREYIHASTRPWILSGVNRAADDPHILHQFGEFWAQVEAAIAVSNQAAVRVEEVRRLKPDDLTEERRGQAAVAVATLKVLATRASVDITSKLFELTGARSTALKYGFNRFWNDARTYTLHNPVAYKFRELGEYALNGQFPPETFYS